MTAVIMPIALLSSPAASAVEQFDLDLVEGELLIRDAEEAQELGDPTSLSGTNTDGQLSDVELETPTITIVLDVPAYNTTATIKADFSMAGPGTGSINEQGDMTVNLPVTVDLGITVPILPGNHQCRATPVNLTLTSTAPHDGDQVTVRAPNFTVPPVPSSDACPGVLAAEVNEALAGAGHSLSLTLEGPLTRPIAGEPTETTLAASPASGARIGDDVTLTATVVPAPAVPGAPPISGSVNFYDGDLLLGSASVAEDGTAAFTTSALPGGDRELTAEYSGAPPDWDPSSASLTYTVLADATLTTDASGEVEPGGAGREIGVTVHNSGFGAPLEDASLEVSIERADGFGPIGPNGPTPRITLSRVVEGVPTPMPLTLQGGFPERLNGVIEGLDVPVGGQLDEELVLSVAAGVEAGPITVSFTLVSSEDEDIATTSGVVTIVNEARQATTLGAGDPGFPPFFPEVLPVTPVVRQGNVVEVGLLRVEPRVGPTPRGTFSFTVGDVPVLAEVDGVSGFKNEVPTGAPVGAAYILRLPPNVPTGSQVVKATYSGDTHYAPTTGSWPITVLPSIGKIYECASQGILPWTFTANVEVVNSTLPPIWATGQDIDLTRTDVRIRMSRTAWHMNVLDHVMQAAPEDRTLELSTAPEGTVAWDSLTRTNSEPPQSGDLIPDHLVELEGGSGTISVDHAPGTSASVVVDSISITAEKDGFIGGMICSPASSSQEHVVGSVTAAGTTLTAAPAGPIAAGGAVTLTATALPAASGVIEFRDGTDTIGVVPVDAAGKATMVTDDLPAGTRNLTARFFGGPVATSPSAAVALRVVGDCSSTTPIESGNGAAVRLVYMELLQRCPDAAGYTYWKGRLDSGTATREQFAREISRSLEARQVIVDDAYRLMLERPAEAAGKLFWAQRLGSNAGYDDLLADLAASPEFWELAGETDEGFVARVYELIIGRTPEPGGLEFWTDYLDRRGGRQLVRALVRLDEPLSALVIEAYEDLLDREPTAEELAAGKAVLASNLDRSALYASIINSDAFFERAQGFPELD